MTNDMTEFSPIPFSTKVIENADRLKSLGLPWTPHVGCFVWDREEVIHAPSPFPNRVYFILNMQRFLNIFGDIEQMRRKLVWVPTWYQAVRICRRLGISDAQTTERSFDVVTDSGENALLDLYQLIAEKLKDDTKRDPQTADSETTVSSADAQWINELVNRELGRLDHLPEKAQERILAVFREAGKAYLGWRRIVSRQGEDWIPPETHFNPEMVAELGHFFSDYQHVMKSVEAVRQLFDHLQRLDPSREPDRYESVMKRLMENDYGSSAPGNLMKSLMEQE